jgi:hypothetical protein
MESPKARPLAQVKGERLELPESVSRSIAYAIGMTLGRLWPCLTYEPSMSSKSIDFAIQRAKVVFPSLRGQVLLDLASCSGMITIDAPSLRRSKAGPFNGGAR